ncbi:MAG: hypothetical protein QM809_16350 [Gordonia sp. (in: high G+C Gram-positive bacteria)]|uniref:hypothetical protein n=1 Tax=Gordonia sp. (in: high G+C Gram-positive bacteria) TaxID=84139 RepID=UPI0039E3345E
MSRIVPQSDDGERRAEVSAEAGLIQRFILAHQPPPGPVHGRWSLGLGDLFAENQRIPESVRPMPTKLNRLGGVEITETTVAFDGDGIGWAAVSEVRTRSLVDYLGSDALDRQMDHLPIPWFPGRDRMIHVFSDAVMSLLVATAREHVERGNDIRIPAEIGFRGGTGQHRQIAPGMLAALIIADPAVMSCLITTAVANRIPIRPADDDAATDQEARVDELIARIDALEAQLAVSEAQIALQDLDVDVPENGVDDEEPVRDEV